MSGQNTKGPPKPSISLPTQTGAAESPGVLSSDRALSAPVAASVPVVYESREVRRIAFLDAGLRVVVVFVAHA